MKNPELEALKEQNPELFERAFYVEDADFLARFGIIIPGKEHLPLGYLKYLPQDFVVEEVAVDGAVHTIDYYGDYDAEVAALPEEAPTYYATLVKCSLTTFQAIAALAEQLGIPEKKIQYAGIKDHRAITAQRVSIRGTTRTALSRVSHPQFFLKDLAGDKGALAIGDLYGNRFTVMIRTDRSMRTRIVAEQFAKNLAYIQERGFFNFFYLQRFGTPRLMNYLWAKRMIRGEYEAAVREFLTMQSPLELPFFRQIRERFAEMGDDFGGMYDYLVGTLPQSLQHEQTVLAYLAEHPGDFKGALLAIEQQARFWFIAYASRLFNMKLSELLLTNQEIPPALPMPDSFVRSDLAFYRRFLEADGIESPEWQYVKTFPQIRIEHREVATRSSVDIHDVEVLEEGIRFSFTLGKGQYATTFFSHLFNLVNGVNWDTDTRFILNDIAPIPEGTREYFREILERKQEEEEAPGA